MRIAAVSLGFLFAMLFGILAISQVSSLQDIGESLTTGALNDLFVLLTPVSLIVIVTGVFIVGFLAFVAAALKH